MRNVILAVVLVCALAAAGLGGTLAGWSDSEISHDNYIETGSLDLQINGEDDPNVPTKVECDCLIPCCENCVVDVEAHNVGQCCDGQLYFHLKRAQCYNIPPEHEGVPTGYEAPDGSGRKPEPELVAEYGGWIDQVEVPGIGEIGDGCSMRHHVSVAISVDGVPIDLSDFDENGDGMIKIGEILSDQIPLSILEPCQIVTVTLAFHLQQLHDDDFGDYFPPGSKFEHWPTNALMKDGIIFDMEFDLIQLPKVG